MLIYFLIGKETCPEATNSLAMALPASHWEWAQLHLWDSVSLVAFYLSRNGELKLLKRTRNILNNNQGTPENNFTLISLTIFSVRNHVMFMRTNLNPHSQFNQDMSTPA